MDLSDLTWLSFLYKSVFDWNFTRKWKLPNVQYWPLVPCNAISVLILILHVTLKLGHTRVKAGEWIWWW